MRTSFCARRCSCGAPSGRGTPIASSSHAASFTGTSSPRWRAGRPATRSPTMWIGHSAPWPAGGWLACLTARGRRTANGATRTATWPACGAAATRSMRPVPTPPPRVIESSSARRDHLQHPRARASPPGRDCRTPRAAVAQAPGVARLPGTVPKARSDAGALDRPPLGGQARGERQAVVERGARVAAPFRGEERHHDRSRAGAPGARRRAPRHRALRGGSGPAGLGRRRGAGGGGGPRRVRRSRRAAVPLRRAPLIGREAPLTRLLEVWAACRQGPRSGIAVIAGDVGLGKTRLLEELVTRARLDGAFAVTVRSVEADRAVPWSGLLGLARGGLGEAPGLAAAPAGALAAVAGLAPEWAERFAAAVRGVAVAPLPHALSDVLRAIVEESPLVLACDDAHWLDRDTVLALSAASRDLARAPLLLVCTVAPE